MVEPGTNQPIQKLQQNRKYPRIHRTQNRRRSKRTRTCILHTPQHHQMPRNLRKHRWKIWKNNSQKNICLQKRKSLPNPETDLCFHLEYSLRKILHAADHTQWICRSHPESAKGIPSTYHRSTRNINEAKSDQAYILDTTIPHVLRPEPPVPASHLIQPPVHTSVE